MRVLFISDVYFPRGNGVSTSIRTFRQDLALRDVHTRLVAPHYASPPEAAPEEQGVLRVPAARVPRDPEDRRMRWRARMRSPCLSWLPSLPDWSAPSTAAVCPHGGCSP